MIESTYEFEKRPGIFVLSIGIIWDVFQGKEDKIQELLWLTCVMNVIT